MLQYKRKAASLDSIATSVVVYPFHDAFDNECQWKSKLRMLAAEETAWGPQMATAETNKNANRVYPPKCRLIVWSTPSPTLGGQLRRWHQL